MCVCFPFQNVKYVYRYELSIAKKHQERKTTRVLSSVCVGGGGGASTPSSPASTLKCSKYMMQITVENFEGPT